jgi:hypothetical protein
VPATVDDSRAAAIARLWRLRDLELDRVGDSLPQAVAERMAAGARVWKPTLMRAKELLAEEVIPTASAVWCEPDQQLVVGEPRDQLKLWLQAVYYPTQRQRSCLDGLTAPDITLPQVETLLGEEGFIEVARPRAWTPPPPLTAASDYGDEGVDIVLVHPDTGWLSVPPRPGWTCTSTPPSWTWSSLF